MKTPDEKTLDALSLACIKAGDQSIHPDMRTTWQITLLDLLAEHGAALIRAARFGAKAETVLRVEGQSILAGLSLALDSLDDDEERAEAQGTNTAFEALLAELDECNS